MKISTNEIRSQVAEAERLVSLYSAEARKRDNPIHQEQFRSLAACFRQEARDLRDEAFRRGIRF